MEEMFVDKDIAVVVGTCCIATGVVEIVAAGDIHHCCVTVVVVVVAAEDHPRMDDCAVELVHPNEYFAFDLALVGGECDPPLLERLVPPPQLVVLRLEPQQAHVALLLVRQLPHVEIPFRQPLSLALPLRQLLIPCQFRRTTRHRH